MNDEIVSSGFSREGTGIPFNDSDMLLCMPAQKSRKRKRRTPRTPRTPFQKKLAELLEQAGLSDTSKFEAVSAERRWRIPSSTLDDLLYNRENPRFKTVEGVARTLGIEPLSLMSLLLDEPPDTTKSDFNLGPLAAVWDRYQQVKRVASKQDQERIDRAIARLMEDMEEILGQR